MFASVCEQSMREIRPCCDSRFIKGVSHSFRDIFGTKCVCRFCDYVSHRLEKLQTATFVGGDVLIARASEIPLQPTRDSRCIHNRRQIQLNETTAFCIAQKLTQLAVTARWYLFCSNDEGTRMSCGLTRRRAKPRRLLIILMGCALIASSVGPSQAQCVEFADRASQVELDAFVKSPSSLLERLRNDKEKLRSRLSTYIATNPSVLPSVQTLISAAASPDRSAIGAALRVAEARCTSTKPDAARKIKDFTQRVGDLAVQAGYSAAGEDASSAPLQPRDNGPALPTRGGALLDGEWKTKLANPFKPVPIPN
jgi:hypothetical protein